MRCTAHDLKTQEEVAAACERAGRYLLGRECPQGGFCFYRSERVNEPNLADTFHAVVALKRLGRTVARRDRLADFLRSFPPSCQPWDLRHLTGKRRAIDAKYTPDRGVRRRIDALRIGPAPPRESPALAGWLERTAIVLGLQRDYGSAFDGTRIGATLEGLLHHGGCGAGPNLNDTWRAVEILRICGARRTWPALAGFVDGLQIPTFGFRATATSCAGRLELVWAGVNCCRALGVPIRHARDALAFVLACQARSGGFAGAPDAAPDIQLTQRALHVLFELASDAGGAPTKLDACCAV